jgi:hypothetical protein
VTTPCPFTVAWCSEHEIDGDGTHICQSTDLELSSGWSLSLTDFHDGSGPVLSLTDPDCYLASTGTNRVDLPGAIDLLAALAAMVRDATLPGALPQAARSPAGAA